MRRKSSFIVLLACCMASSLQAQVDTLGKCPFYFMDAAIKDVLNMQEHTDSCNAACHCFEYPYPVGMSADDYYDFNGGYAIQMHTDDTIRVVGIALGGHWNNRPVRLTIYDSSEMYQASPVPLAATTMPADVIVFTPMAIFVITDSSNMRHIWHPGLLNPSSQACNVVDRDLIWLSFFEDGEVLNITGDFFVGISSIDSLFTLPQHHSIIWEKHDPPYHLPSRTIRLERDKVWEDHTVDRYLPILFPIVEPKCEKVEAVTVSTDSMGCIVASWDSLPRQEQWVVTCQTMGSTFTIIDTVDACHWRYCGLPDGASYSIKVRSRCTNLNSYSWSDWNNANGVGITPVAADSPIHVSPNPVHGVVEVTLPQPLESDGVLSLYDLGGREMRHMTLPAGSRGVTLDTEGCDAGAYVLKLTTPQGVATRRLLIAR